MQAVSATPRHKRPPLQTVQSISIPESLLKLQTVIEVTGMSESTIKRRISDGSFPKPIRLGTRCVRWVAGQVSDWLRSQAQAEVQA